MASVVTNRGLYRWLGIVFRNATAPGTYYAALACASVGPTADTNVFGDLHEVDTGNGYAHGGNAVARSAVGFDTWTEDDGNDRALVQLADVVFTAAGGDLPSAGGGARWMCVTDDSASVGAREVYGAFDLASDRSISNGQSLTVQDAEFRITH